LLSFGAESFVFQSGEWRGLHNQELLCCLLLTKYHLGDQIKKNEVGMACGMYGGDCAYWVLMGRPFGRPGHKWEGNIKMDLQEM